MARRARVPTIKRDRALLGVVLRKAYAEWSGLDSLPGCPVTVRVLRNSSPNGLLLQQIDLSPEFGGAERDRTADLLIANEALSQLSYGP